MPPGIGTSQISPLVDSALAMINWKKLPDWRQYNHIPYYRCPYYQSDSGFKKIIDQINGMKFTRTAFLGHRSKQLQAKIDQVPDKEKQAYLKLHFFYHFLYSYDDSLYDPSAVNSSSLLKYIYVSDTTLPLAIKAKQIEAIGDLYATVGESLHALKFFLGAEEAFEKLGLFYDAGFVENKIGKLYCNAGKVHQIEFGFKHFDRAASLFLKAGSTKEAIQSLLQVNTWMPIYMYDIGFIESPFEGISETITSRSLGFTINAYQRESYTVENDNDTVCQRLLESWEDTLSVDNYYLSSGDAYKLLFAGKFDTAVMYYQRALYAAVQESYPDYNLANVIDGLNNLVWAYSSADSFNQAVGCMEWALFLSRRSHNQLSLIHTMFSCGNNLWRLKKYDLAASAIKQGENLIDSLNLDPYLKRDLKYREIKFCASQCLCDSFLSGFLSAADTNARFGLVSQGDRMIRYEQRTKAYRLQTKISDQETRLSELSKTNDSLATKQLELLELGARLVNSNDSLGALNVLQQDEIDSQMKAMMLLRSTRDQMEEDVESKQVTINHQENVIVKNNEILGKTTTRLANAILGKWIAITCGALLMIVGTVIYVIRVRAKNRRYAHLEAQYSYERDKLTDLAKAKLHNIRGNYTKVMNLLDTGEFDTAKGYVENAADYFTVILNRASDAKWTIENELNLLDKFYNAEKILYGEVEIIRIIDRKILRAPFLSDILTTLLHNSMRHAFITISSGKKFTVEVSIHEEWLHFTVSDNGIAKASQDNYFPKTRPDSGLAILKERIIHECYHRAGAIREDFFELHLTEPCKGTTFTFKYPYNEIPIKSAGRRRPKRACRHADQAA